MASTREVSKAMVVTIDGPAGAGKTSVSKLLARKLGYRYLDTGALYRAVAVAALDADIAADDDAALTELCQRIRVDLQADDAEAGTRVMLNGEDVTNRIRTPQVSMMASDVSARPVVRQFLLETQRTLGRQKGVVAEGRDMGTVVFPDAEAKFFLDADPEVRARRRHTELAGGNTDSPSLAAVEQDMRLRDKNDSSRRIAPLRPADDAITLDSTHLSLDQVVAKMIDHLSRLT